MSINARGPCQHCKKVRSLQCRGLCHTCYYVTPGVRERYPARVNQHGKRRELGLGLTAPARPAAVATRALQGTEAKITAMRERLERGEHLYHPEDGEPS